MAIDPSIKKELERYLHNRVGKDDNRAIVLSAYQLTTGEIKSIQRAMPVLKNYEIENVVSDKIIGGFIIKFDTKIIDLSLYGQLKNFKKLMYEID